MKISFLHHILSMEKAVAGVELQTGHKTCVIECGHCALTQNVVDQENTLDENVRVTFNIVQEFLRKNNIYRYLNYGFPLKWKITNSFPELLDLHNLTKVQVWFGKIMPYHETDVAAVSQQTIEKLIYLLEPITKHNISRKNWRWTIESYLQHGPKGVLITQNERDLIWKVFESYRPFIVENNYPLGEMWFDLNMVSAEHIIKNQENLVAEKSYFEEELYNILWEGKMRTSQSERDDELLWWRMMTYATSWTSWKSTFTFRKRLIAKTQKDSLERYQRIALGYLNYKNSAYISIYPHWVLINHSSLDVSNPFLWVSHERLRVALLAYVWFKKRGIYELNTVLTNLIEENLKEHFYFKEFSEEHTALVAKSILHPKV